MPVEFSHFRADHKSIGEFLVSGQLRDAVRGGADDVARIANATTITKLKGEYYVEHGPDVIVTKNGNPRLSEQVRCDHPAAAAIEFGSGRKKDRPQGGSSDPKRILGKAGEHVGDAIGGE